MEWIVGAYLWIKAFHVMSVIAWMAGLFYLPRLYVHHVEQAKPGSEMERVFQMMEYKLLKVIMNPAMISSWIFGLLLVAIFFHTGADGGWLHVKLLFVVLLSVFHMWLGARRRALAEGRDTLTGRQYRLMNEVPTVVMVVVVIMAVVKPF